MKKFALIFIFIFVSIFSSVCKAEEWIIDRDFSTGIIILNQELRLYLEGVVETLPQLPSQKDGSPIRNCTELLEALQSGIDLGERLERREFAAYSMCLAGAVAVRAEVVSATKFDLHNAGQQILDHLDLSTVRSSLAQRSHGSNYFLSDFGFSLLRINPLSVETADDEFSYRFDILAAGDFRHSGYTELLVRFVDRATVGSYDSTAILILDWLPDRQNIEAMDAVDFLSGAKRLDAVR